MTNKKVDNINNTEPNTTNTQETEQLKPKAFILDYAAISKLIVKDLSKPNSQASTFFKRYTKEDIRRFLETPEKHQKQLREISRYLYHASNQYKRLIKYFAGILTFDYIVEPYDIDISKVNIDRLKTNYNKTLNILDTMNLKHEFGKILRIAFKEDVFYGYEHFNKDSYFIQHLNPDYCEITSVEDGVFNFSFDFKYFDLYKDKLDQYPAEFKQKYQVYLQNKAKQRWIELDAKKTICIKINEDINYPINPFVGVIEALIDLDEFKALNKTRQEIGNYKLLIEEIETKKDSDIANDFTVDLDTAIMFHNKLSQALPDGVGAALSPLKLNEISFNKDKAETDYISQAERDYWASTGTSQALFSQESATSVTISKSIITDEMVAFDVLHQLNRWLNRKLKFVSTGVNKFRVNMLEITRFNRDEYFEKMLKASQFGLPAKSMAVASLGLSPSAMNNMTFLENDVLGLADNWIPLQSSHTSSGDKEAGRPSEGEAKTEDGLKTGDEGGNDRE